MAAIIAGAEDACHPLASSVGPTGVPTSRRRPVRVLWSPPIVASGIEIGFLLDHLWHQMRGEMEQSKRPALLAVARILAGARVPYAVIGGVALQVLQQEPRTSVRCSAGCRH
jgi:hypothetical protein